MEEWQINIISTDRDPVIEYYANNTAIVDFCIGPIEVGDTTGQLHFHTYVKTELHPDSIRKALRARYKKPRQVQILQQKHTYKENISYILKSEIIRVDFITNIDSNIIEAIPQWEFREKPETSRKRQLDFKAYIDANIDELKQDYKDFLKTLDLTNIKTIPSRYDYYAFSFFTSLGVPFDRYQVKKYANLLTVKHESFNHAFMQIMQNY